VQKYKNSEVVDFLKEFVYADMDGISFFCDPATDDLDLNTFYYAAGESTVYKQGALGNYYHILLYKPSENRKDVDIDVFDAILTDPSVYVSNMIQHGFSGIVTKITESSRQYIAGVYFQLCMIYGKTLDEILGK
jgi:hypothetical protein